MTNITMIDDVRDLNDAELEAVAGGIDLGAVAEAVGNAASGVGNRFGSVGLGLRKSAGNDASGICFLSF
jgi:hypothetical protein